MTDQIHIRSRAARENITGEDVQIESATAKKGKKTTTVPLANIPSQTLDTANENYQIILLSFPLFLLYIL